MKIEITKPEYGGYKVIITTEDGEPLAEFFAESRHRMAAKLRKAVLDLFSKVE